MKAVTKIGHGLRNFSKFFMAAAEVLVMTELWEFGVRFISAVREDAAV